ncbi:MAG: hypothetical protein ABIM99_05995 [Candidatus Dojkabacteria bacterium]
MKFLKFSKKGIIFFIVFFLIGAAFSMGSLDRNLEAATCGAPGTCYGMRQNPPGGCGCYTDAEGCGSGCGGNPPNNPPACVPQAHSDDMTLVLPANGATNVPKPATFKWTNPTNWGSGCPNTNTNVIYYKIKTTSVCVDGNPWANTGLFAASTTHTLDVQLEYGTTYCWYMGSYNGYNSNYSNQVWEFTTSKLPIYTGGGLTGIDVCGNQSSGRLGSTGVTNPIEWTANFTNPEAANKMEWFTIAIVPTTGIYAVTTDTADYTTTYTKAVQSGGALFAINTTGGVLTYKSLKLSPTAWTTAAVGATSLNMANGRTTLMDLGTGTKLTQTGQDASVKFKISFANTFTPGTYNIYVNTLVSNPTLGGLMASNNATAASHYFFKKSGTWKVDPTPPTGSISGPTLNADGTFNMIWTGTDNIGLSDIRSYVYSDVAGSMLHDNTINLDISTPTTEQVYPAASNAGITGKNQGSHNYKDLTPDNGAEYTFKIYVKDSSCNFVEAVIKKNPLTPWILGQNGDISGRGGIAKTRIPPLGNFTVPFTSQTGPAYFSNYSSISGTNTNALGTISKYSFALNTYLDDSIMSPHDSTGLWYDYLLDKVSKNQKTTIVTIPATIPKTISATMSSGLAVGKDAKAAVEITGDLIVNSATKCDLKAIVFVRGNLSINPDFTIATAPPTSPVVNQLYNGCMFIVKGNVNIGLGTAKTNLPTASATQASYDQIDAFIITDGIFSAPVDGHGAGKKGDGLYVNGGLVARVTANPNSTIKRDIVQEGNNLQPAMLFNLDPRMKIMFAEDFASRDYEIREYGL